MNKGTFQQGQHIKYLHHQHPEFSSWSIAPITGTFAKQREGYFVGERSERDKLENVRLEARLDSSSKNVIWAPFSFRVAREVFLELQRQYRLGTALPEDLKFTVEFVFGQMYGFWTAVQGFEPEGEVLLYSKHGVACEVVSVYPWAPRS